MSPWFSSPERFFLLYGAIGGSLVGVVGGVIGTAAGILAPQGKGHGLVLPVVRRAYLQAEPRKLDAATIRNR